MSAVCCGVLAVGIGTCTWGDAVAIFPPDPPDTPNTPETPDTGVDAGTVFQAGDAERGRLLTHTHAGAGCLSCHRFERGGPGAEAGPGLWQIGSDRSAASLLESLTDPAAVIVRGYEQSPPMPPMADRLTPEQLLDVVAYLRSLQDPSRGPAQADTGGALTPYTGPRVYNPMQHFSHGLALPLLMMGVMVGLGAIVLLTYGVSGSGPPGSTR